MKNFFLIITIAAFFTGSMFAQRIKDIAFLEGSKQQQIIGYGLIVGLAGTGDSQRSSFTVQSVTSMLKRLGITVPQTNLKTKNVAAVMVTATLNSSLKPGATFDVNVASLGDAKSLTGGNLLMTPLSGLDGTVYGFAQGPISVGGFDVSTASGGRVAKNHVLAGRVPRGGILDLAVNEEGLPQGEIKLYLRDPDITTSSNVMGAINTQFGNNIAMAVDASEIKVQIPEARSNDIIGFLSELESLNVTTDNIAKVVLNERTGTVVAGHNVIIQPVSITHGNLNITVRSNPMISQPGPFSRGSTAIFNNLIPYAEQDSSRTIALEKASNVQEVAAALNSLKVAPNDIIAIFQALKESGSLTAELIIM